MEKSKIFLIIAMVLIFIISSIGAKGALVENLGIPEAIGYDIENSSDYSIPFLMYSIQDDQISSNVYIGKGNNIIETRENRQLKVNKKTFSGLCRLYIFSEDSSRNGLENELDTRINNAEVNDRAMCVVCKGKAEDILKYNVKGYPSSAEYIEGMSKNLQQYNFFSLQDTVVDLYVRFDAEGRNALLPYVEIKDTGIETTGLAIFKKDKVVGIANMDETRIINILKEDNVKGIFTLKNDLKHYINCYTYSKRKTNCYKENGKYKFIINLDLKGNIVSNELYANLYEDSKTLKEFEGDMKKYLEKMCTNLINKVKTEYKTDILDLGRVAAAKYGRGTGTDWNAVVSNSPIEVHVKFSVDTEGRGNYIMPTK